MAYTLVGVAGTPNVAPAGNSISPVGGQNATAGNLMVCLVVGTGTATLPAAPVNTSAGVWNIGIRIAGTSCSASIFWVVAVDNTDAAPTVQAIASTVLSGQTIEFAGNPASSANDKTGTGTGTTSPVTATFGSASTTSGELWVAAGADFRSTARLPNDTWTSNHGSPTLAGSNNGISSVNHYSFAYLLSTTSNSGADTAVMTISTTTSLTGAAVAAMTFLLPGAASPYVSRVYPQILAQ